MTDQDKDRQLDEMLDALLAMYSSAEPRPGLETRILANVQDATGKQGPATWWNFKWLWAGAVVAAVIVGGVLIRGKRPVAPPPRTVVQNVQPAVQQPTVQQPVVRQPVIQKPRVQSSVPAAVGSERVIHRHKTWAQEPQRDATLARSQRPSIFPTPTPLSEQERLMFTYLANTPQEIVVAQIPHNDDQKEAEAFWADREPSSGTRRSTTNQ